MELIYRGCKFEYQPVNLVKVDSPITAKYRGLNYQVPHWALETPLVVKAKCLKYRGVAYIDESQPPKSIQFQQALA